MLIVIGAAAGLIPRWLHRSALRAETRELAVRTVGVVSPAPGKNAAGLPLPAEVKALVEAPIHARTNGYVIRCLVDIGAQVSPGICWRRSIPRSCTRKSPSRARAHPGRSRAGAGQNHGGPLGRAAQELQRQRTGSRGEEGRSRAQVRDRGSGPRQSATAGRVESFEHVIAPFCGTIIARETDVGQFVTPGSAKELFRLAQTETLRVYVRVPQSRHASGQMAELIIPEMPGRVFPAKVVRTAGAMNADSRTLLTELEVDNANGKILAGSYAQVRFPEAKADPTLTLPSNTLLFRAEGPQVGVVRADGKVELRSVTVGRDFGPTMEILQGVGPTDRVIMNPPDSLVGGTTVRVAEPPARERPTAVTPKSVGS